MRRDPFLLGASILTHSHNSLHIHLTTHFNSFSFICIANTISLFQNHSHFFSNISKKKVLGRCLMITESVRPVGFAERDSKSSAKPRTSLQSGPSLTLSGEQFLKVFSTFYRHYILCLLSRCFYRMVI